MSKLKHHSVSGETELPIQAPVEEPVINSPFEEPKRHWVYDKEGRARKADGRREAAYFYTTQKVMTGQQELEGIAFDYGSEPLRLVNALRKDVKRWRESGYEGATKTTRRLFEHWRGDARKERGARRFFFCQIEAVETVIYLNEILSSERRTRWKPEVTAEDFKALILGKKPPQATARADTFFPTLRDGALTRYGCKMATGSGKTVVMAMLLAWAFCNRGAVPGDTRFPSAALVCCPNLTVKERLQVLRTDGNLEKSYFAQFDIVPPVLRGFLAAGRVLVTNWHAFASESEHTESGKTYAVVDKGEEGADAFAQRVLRDLHGRGELLVLNDEAHHAYRPAPPEKAVAANRGKKHKKDGESAFGDATSEDLQEATVWVEGLDKLAAAVGVKCCVDLSATPFYLAGSGHVEGSPFPWLVSDFGLVDAIESGITKIPRLPVADITGRPDPKFFRLWEKIKQRLKEQGDANFTAGKPRPEAVWREANDAFITLASQWKMRFEQNVSAKPGQNFIPPVLIVVCDNTELAQIFFEKISGETVAEIEEGEDNGIKTVRKERRFSPDSVPLRELANELGKTVTVRIDSKLLAEAEGGGTKQQEAERLREIIANVGKQGTVGEHIRCVISVQMLTEGWDASNVTQILGLRAFGSQLLCEQVVGRGLRRISYDTEIIEVGGQKEERLHPEYVDVYGIPFSIIPFKGRPSKGGGEEEDKPTTRVSALPERVAMAMPFPNVDGYVFALRKHKVKCDVTKMEPLEIRPMDVPTIVFVQPQVGVKEGQTGRETFQRVTHDREAFYAEHHAQTVLFEIARVIVAQLTTTSGNDGKEGKLKNYARHQLFPQVFAFVEEYAARRIKWNGCDPRELALEVYAQKLLGLFADAIEPDESGGEPPLMPLFNRFKSRGSTAEVSFLTKRPCHPTQKSHIDTVVLDTDTWERSVAFQLEASAAVAFYARNDHLGLEIPYEFYGVSHRFLPDFLVRLTNGVNLLLEVKGYEGAEEAAKHEAAKRWAKAVNNWGRMGRWCFHVCKNPDTLRTEIEYLSHCAISQ